MEHPADCDEMPSRRGSNFGRVDALRWWFKLRHDGAPPCPGACFQTQRSKRKPHERAMCDNLEVAVSRVTVWAANEIERFSEGSETRKKLHAILDELPAYGSAGWDEFNDLNLLPLLRGLKEGTIGRKHRESEGVLLCDSQRAMRTAETLETMGWQLMCRVNSLYEDAKRMSVDDPAKASRVTKLLTKQLFELQKLSGSAELPCDLGTPPREASGYPLSAFSPRVGAKPRGAGGSSAVAGRSHEELLAEEELGEETGEELGEGGTQPTEGCRTCEAPHAAVLRVVAAVAPPPIAPWLAVLSSPPRVGSGEGDGRAAALAAERLERRLCEGGGVAESVGAERLGAAGWPERESDDEPTASQASLVRHLEDLSSQEAYLICSGASQEEEDEMPSPSPSPSRNEQPQQHQARARQVTARPYVSMLALAHAALPPRLPPSVAAALRQPPETVESRVKYEKLLAHIRTQPMPGGRPVGRPKKSAGVGDIKLAASALFALGEVPDPEERQTQTIPPWAQTTPPWGSDQTQTIPAWVQTTPPWGSELGEASPPAPQPASAQSVGSVEA